LLILFITRDFQGHLRNLGTGVICLYALLSLRVVGVTVAFPFIAGGHISGLTDLMIILASIFSFLWFNVSSCTDNRLLFLLRAQKNEAWEDPVGYVLDLRRLDGLELQNLVELGGGGGESLSGFQQAKRKTDG
jgi:hypothetical protein